ncbi:MAG: glycosyltransferase family 2 protein [Burkholderiales bacterium]
MIKACFVIPEISHIGNNDVPLSIYNFANIFINNGVDVTILYTSTCNDTLLEYWDYKFKEIGAKFEFLLANDINIHLSAADLFFRNSYAVYKKLENRSFDFIFFTDFYAAGFHTIQAKKTTSLFKNTTITIIMLGSSEYILECKEERSKIPVFDLRLQYAERYCCENADIVVGLTEFIMKWADSRNWKLAKKRYVLSLSDSFINGPGESLRYKSIIFWGNYEDYNCIKAFCKAINNLRDHNRKYKISLVFDSPRSTNIDKTIDYITHIFNNKIRYSVEKYYDVSEALAYIKEKQGLAVIMSSTGDYQWKIAECIKSKVPFLVVASDAIPELVGKRQLFESNILFLENNLQSHISMGLNYQYKKDYLEKFWIDFLKESINSGRKAPLIGVYPKVSVCVAYYNHGKYLPMLLRSLEKNTYPNFEVIIVNDGSTDSYSISVFKEMADKYQSEKYKFFSKENEFVGKTRNFAVDKACGEYIVFIDSDDVAAPDMIEKYVTGIMNSGCDCLSAYMHYFDGELELEQSVISEGIYSPTGPILELAMFENCIGGVNIIIKKDTFVSAGGFSEERFCYEDWRFLVKLALKGYHLDVIPICLYYYRILPDSMIRSKNDYKNHNWLISVFYEEMPQYMKYLVRDFCIPSWNMWKEKLCGTD